ncbi:MAG: hypothetical protein WCD11_14590 [Solirubrobacteraceae bacterium]
MPGAAARRLKEYTSQQVGGALGLAILATVANSRTQSLFHAGVHSTAVTLTNGFDRAFLVGAGLPSPVRSSPPC